MQQLCDFFALRQQQAVVFLNGFAKDNGNAVNDYTNTEGCATANQHGMDVQNVLQHIQTAPNSYAHNGGRNQGAKQIAQNLWLLGGSTGDGKQI
jgi:hypothetical protein